MPLSEELRDELAGITMVVAQLSWRGWLMQIGSTVGYQIKDWMWVRAGYRHLHVDYEDDGFVFDVDMSGPILGIGFRF